jgi:radical SAM superfamily enzyme YgiQ (UPF0313 family)
MRVGFFGLPATHMPELFEGFGDFIIKGEPEEAAMRLAAGEDLNGIVKAMLPIILMRCLSALGFGQVAALRLHQPHKAGLTRALPMFTSRSCPEHCTYCPHRITASFRARSVDSVLAEMEELATRYTEPHIVIRDPLLRSTVNAVSASPKEFARRI